MTPKEFCYWLMGSLELTPTENGFNEEQTQILRNHLDMVFVHMVKEDGTLREEKVWKFGDPLEGSEIHVNC